MRVDWRRRPTFPPEAFLSMKSLRFLKSSLVAATVGAALSTQAAVMYFGDVDVLNTGATYSSDPTIGAQLTGVAPGFYTVGANGFGHSYPFAPDVGDFPGTDQIYVGSNQTGAMDGYASSPRVPGPQVLNLDYSPIAQAGPISLTLGLMLSDFQQPSFGQPYTASINGVIDLDLTILLNAVDQGGPITYFISYGVSPGLLTPDNKLVLSIDQGGNGGDGWAIDFATIGITAVPEPSEWTALVGLTLLAGAIARRLAKHSKG